MGSPFVAKPGWGENMAYCRARWLTRLAATWFDMDWHATLDTPEWKNALVHLRRTW